MTSPNDTGATTVITAARAAATLHVVRVRAVFSPGLSGTVLSGLPADSLRHTRDRVYAAVLNSGLGWHHRRVELSVFPDNLPAGDSGIDLAFAVALLALTGQAPRLRVTERANVAYLGELGLDGRLRPVPGTAQRLDKLAHAGVTHAIVPASDLTTTAAAAAEALGVTVRAADTLADLVNALHGRQPLLPPRPRTRPQPADWTGAPPADLASLPVDHPGRRVLEIAAAGGHHLNLTGPDGTGKTLLAELLPGLLPDLDEPTATEVDQLYRAAGLSDLDSPLPHRPPWQAPHHTTTVTALTGNVRRPGAFGLAHGGLLFCDYAAEFAPRALDVLCSVLDHRRVSLQQGDRHRDYPARLQLVLASTGCPQGGADCICEPGVHRRYRARLDRLLDRVDLHAGLPAMPPAPAGPSGQTTAQVAARVADARAVAAARWAGHGVTSNGEASSADLRASVAGVPRGRFALLRDRVTAGSLTPRAATGTLRVAWTLADLAGRSMPDESDVNEALDLRHGPVAS